MPGARRRMYFICHSSLAQRQIAQRRMSLGIVVAEVFKDRLRGFGASLERAATVSSRSASATARTSSAFYSGVRVSDVY
jgi:hypothetical protein